MNDQKHVPGRHADRADWRLRTEDPLPCISVRNLQRKIRVNVGELKTFAAGAVQRSLQLRKGKRNDLRRLREVFVWLVSDRRMVLLHRQFFGQLGPRSEEHTSELQSRF